MAGLFKGKSELLKEISALKRRIKEVERSEAERLRAERALKEGEELLEAYLENAPDGIYINDLEGTFLYGNRKGQEITGYGREDLIGKKFLELGILQGASREKAAELFKINVTGKSTGPDELELISKEGRPVSIEITTSLVQHGDRKVVVGFVRDITDRKQAEAAIRKYSNDLKERVKELNCLYSISEMVRRRDISQEEILQECASILSQAYQYPEITACRITWGDREWKTENFRETKWRQSSAIMVHGLQVGTIEVCYLEKRWSEQEGPFLTEERSLINAIAEFLGRSLEHKQAREERENLIVELRRALDNVNTLSGLLPICSACKRIRNDKGYWEQIEVYIRDHSEADFSHGICPECARKLYPEYYKEI